MSLESDIVKTQKSHFSSDKSAHISFDAEDIEKYSEKVEKEFHKRRRQVWWSSYKINYRNRHKDQKRLRKSELD